MAYTPATNRPKLIAQPINNPRLWVYASADALATVTTNGYFTDGYDLGIRAGDIMIISLTTTFAATIAICNQASAALGVDFTDGVAIAATDTA